MGNVIEFKKTESMDFFESSRKFDMAFRLGEHYGELYRSAIGLIECLTSCINFVKDIEFRASEDGFIILHIEDIEGAANSVFNELTKDAVYRLKFSSIEQSKDAIYIHLRGGL